MSTNRPAWSELMLSQTLWPRFAPSFHYRNYRLTNEKLFIPSLNVLALRHNENNSQSNIYGIIGAGNGHLLAVEGDWETRRFYTSGRAESIGRWETQPSQLARLRLGFAPYLAEMDGLHTWIVVQSEYETRTETFDWTPLLRVSYVSVLLEFGYSDAGIWHFNWSTEF